MNSKYFFYVRNRLYRYLTQLRIQFIYLKICEASICLAENQNSTPKANINALQQILASQNLPTHKERPCALKNLGISLPVDTLSGEQLHSLSAFLYINRDLFAWNLSDWSRVASFGDIEMATVDTNISDACCRLFAGLTAAADWLQANRHRFRDHVQELCLLVLSDDADAREKARWDECSCEDGPPVKCTSFVIQN